MVNPEGYTVLANKLDLKHQCYNRIYVITIIHKLLLKELLMLQIQILMCMKKNWLLKIMHNLSAKFQKLIIHSLIIIFTLQCLCIMPIIMPIYMPMIEYSDNYSDTSESLWQFKRDEVLNNNADLTADNS